MLRMALTIGCRHSIDFIDGADVDGRREAEPDSALYPMWG